MSEEAKQLYTYTVPNRYLRLLKKSPRFFTSILTRNIISHPEFVRVTFASEEAKQVYTSTVPNRYLRLLKKSPRFFTSILTRNIISHPEFVRVTFTSEEAKQVYTSTESNKYLRLLKKSPRFFTSKSELARTKFPHESNPNLEKSFFCLRFCL